MIFLSNTFDFFLNLNIIIFLISQSLFPTGMFILASNYIYIFIFFIFSLTGGNGLPQLDVQRQISK